VAQPVADNRQESQGSATEATFRISSVAVRLVIGVGGVFIGFVLGSRFAASDFGMDLAATGQFITALFDAVAWPVGILVIVLIFKEQIRSKIVDLTSADIHGNRLEFVQRRFAKSINEANRLTEKIGNESGIATGEGGGNAAHMPPQAQETLDRASELVDKQPKESMIASFEPVKAMILDAAKDKGVFVEPTSPVHEVLNYLSSDISEDTVKAVESLENARRDAFLIEGPISTDAARNYVNSAQNLAQSLPQQMNQ
jgi:hypothetical protein